MRSLLLVLTLLAPTVGAAAEAPREFPVDGWYSWQVAAVDDAPGWCCVHWNRGRSTATACDLDANDFNFGHFNFADDGSHAADEAELQVYALIRDGEAVRVRAMSPACPVESQGSASRLRSCQRCKRPLRESEAIYFDREKDKELREEAVFWLGQARIAESMPTIVELMFGDEDPDMRAHAAFALAQSSAPERTELLIRQGREDRAADVRGEAWLWLAQSGAPESEAAIFAALREDPSEDGREQAVFALSELPDERAVGSLTQIVRDTGMDLAIREQALFWLAQSDSDEAYEVIDTLLSKHD